MSDARRMGTEARADTRRRTRGRLQRAANKECRRSAQTNERPHQLRAGAQDYGADRVKGRVSHRMLSGWAGI